MQIGKLKNELEQIQKKAGEFEDIIRPYDRVIIIGNGGSNAVASHIAQDYTKMLGKKAISFSDGSRLTCYINDFGRDQAYVEFIRHFWEEDTMVILISSSGNSMNIVNAAKFCRDNDYPYMALSGFDEDNKLNSKPCHFKYHVKSHDYGVVECAHQIMLHTILPKEEIRGVVAGAFDIIHPGYVKMFKEARNKSTHLTVLLHTDPNSENGKMKPIQSVEERKETLLAMKYVDEVKTYDNEIVLEEHLKVGKFDIRFLGEDYKDKNYTGSELNLDIHWIDRSHDYSTTKLKRQIKNSMED